MFWDFRARSYEALQFPPRPLTTLTLEELSQYIRSLGAPRPPCYEEAQANMRQNHVQREMHNQLRHRDVSGEDIR